MDVAQLPTGAVEEEHEVEESAGTEEEPVALEEEAATKVTGEEQPTFDHGGKLMEPGPVQVGPFEVSNIVVTKQDGSYKQ